ncbi:hypothetical protein [Amycolatopsis sp. cg13]|uniref:hypothetical protein n=1 Tax=Amycolatopsis sp. cg13 TaxID=3238807 RepID=UPI003523AC46
MAWTLRAAGHDVRITAHLGLADTVTRRGCVRSISRARRGRPAAARPGRRVEWLRRRDLRGTSVRVVVCPRTGRSSCVRGAGSAGGRTRAKFLELLLFLVGEAGQSERAEREGRDLAAECAAAAKSGIWLLYAEIFSGRRVDAAAYAYETLSLVEEDEERLALLGWLRVSFCLGIRDDGECGSG